MERLLHELRMPAASQLLNDLARVFDSHDVELFGSFCLERLSALPTFEELMQQLCAEVPVSSHRLLRSCLLLPALGNTSRCLIC